MSSSELSIEAPTATRLRDGKSQRQGPPPVLSAIGRVLVRQAGLLLALGAWWAWVTFGEVSTVVAPHPTEVFGDIVFEPSAYLGDLYWTAVVSIGGLLLGAVLAVALATLAWYAPVFGGMITPPVLVVRSVPMVAMVPVFARVFGYSTTTILVVSVLVAYFPIFVLTLSGLRSMSPSSQDVFRVYGANRRKILVRLALPSAIPNVLVGLRISAVTCVVGAMIAEYLIGTRGLGQLFVISQLRFEIARSWGVGIVATGFSVLLFTLASRLEIFGRERMT